MNSPRKLFPFVVLLFLTAHRCGAAVSRFHVAPATSTLVYLEPGQRLRPFTCPGGECPLQLAGILGLDYGATTANFADVNVHLLGRAPEWVTDQWFSELLQEGFPVGRVENETTIVFQNTSRAGSLTVQLDGNRMTISGGYDLRPVDGDGAAIDATAFGADVNHDGRIDATDIDFVARCALASADGCTYADVNGDGIETDFADLQVLVEELVATYFGDANLDRQFNSSDLVIVFQAGQYEDDVPGNSTWATGDWNGSHEFDSGDLVLAFQRGGYEAGVRLPARGDFNRDGLLDAQDIDLLTSVVLEGSHVTAFDLNADGLVTFEDRQWWIERIKKTCFGDANLDGNFDSSDFVVVFQAGEYENLVLANSTWAEGDWNGDGDFTSDDFSLVFQGHHLANCRRGPDGEIFTVRVPEPRSTALAVLAALAPLILRCSSRGRGLKWSPMVGMSPRMAKPSHGWERMQ